MLCLRYANVHRYAACAGLRVCASHQSMLKLGCRACSQPYRTQRRLGRFVGAHVLIAVDRMIDMNAYIFIKLLILLIFIISWLHPFPLAFAISELLLSCRLTLAFVICKPWALERCGGAVHFACNLSCTWHERGVSNASVTASWAVIKAV